MPELIRLHPPPECSGKWFFMEVDGRTAKLYIGNGKKKKKEGKLSIVKVHKQYFLLSEKELCTYI